MKTFLVSGLLSVATALGAPLAAQQPAEATLFTRVEDGHVLAAIEIDIEDGWHLYHKELGHPRAIGQKTTVELSGEGITWSDVWFPEPEIFDQSDIEEGVYILGHEGLIALYAVGKLAPGAKGDDVQAKLAGLVCEVSCLPLRETLESQGKGPDSLFADLPAELRPGGAPVPAKPAVQRPTKDEREAGRADATVYTRVEDGWVLAAIEIAIEKGWHLYHVDKGNPDGIGKPTELVLHGEGIRWQEPIWPHPEKVDQSDIEDGLWIHGHEGTIVVHARGALAPDAPEDAAQSVWVELKGQNCNEEACINYAEKAVTKGAGPDALFAAFPKPGAHGPDGELEEPQGLAGFLLLAVFWGLFTLLMPCTYPMIPITISFFTKQADARGGRVLPLSLTYGAGIVAIFILIGVAFGQVIIPFATHWLTNLVIGVLFLYFALVLFGVVKMEPPRFLMRAAGKAQTTGGYLGVFLMGATLVVTSFTCTAPFVGSLLSVGATGGDLGRIVLGMGTFGLTMAIPFVLLSLVPGRIQAMPKSGEWMNTLKFFLGFVELAAAFKFLSNTDVVLDWFVLSRELFLLLWGAIFALAALYLLGVIFRQGSRPGPKRVASGVLTGAFAVYCFLGMAGREMDSLMTAIIPPYSGGLITPEWHDENYDWAIVENDYDAARALALKEGKLLFLNFTGYT